MKKLLLQFALGSWLLALGFSAYSQSEDFNSGWEFSYQGKYFPATVPGTIHTDLLNNKLIDDPFYRDNVNKLQWISDSDWVYRKTFLFDTSKRIFQDLIFAGLDTYADVFINDKIVLHANNMFKEWNIDLYKYCQQGNNEIIIIFRSATKIAAQLAANYSIKLPGGEYSFIRKAAYNFGWDFAPRLITCGIWKNVYINHWRSPCGNFIPLWRQKSYHQIQEVDSLGSNFYFVETDDFKPDYVQPYYMKGANIVPPDVFMPRVTNEKYRQLVFAAKDAHMNMLRVWGGGVYLDDYFYHLCDSTGINVWQDFMFAGAMYPFDDSAFLANVMGECIQQLQRLNKHPCIVLWCGNNEIDEAWHNWNWQRDYKLSANDSTKLWNAYKNFFDTILPSLIKLIGSKVPYISSSPQIGWGHDESFQQGDSHYWGVWWGMEPFSAYTTHVGRFVSEFGFQSLPTMSTIEKFTLPEDRNISSAVMMSHQTCNGGFEKLNAYMKMYHMKPKTFSDYVNATQQLQVEAMKTAISSQMNSKKCMGSLMWQLNDCWPCASWSAIDYYGNKKPVYDELKILFSGK